MSPDVTRLRRRRSRRAAATSPAASRPTHSPTAFIQRARRRVPGERARPPRHGRVRHPPVRRQLEPVARRSRTRSTTTIGVADYGKLVALLGEAFDGTAQPGSELPIFYGEFGVESEIPAAKASLYTGTEPTTTKPVSESTQAAYYEQALALAFCQPTVDGMLLFLSRDERARPAGSRASTTSTARRRRARARVTRGARSHDRRLDHALPGRPARRSARPSSASGRGPPRKRGVFRASFSCDLDCRYWVRLENAVTHSTKLAAQGPSRGRRARPGRSRDATPRRRGRTATRSGSSTP